MLAILARITDYILAGRAYQIGIVCGNHLATDFIANAPTDISPSSPSRTSVSVTYRLNS